MNSTLVAREDQPFDGGTMRTFVALNKVTYSGAQRRSFNSNGQIIAKVIFTDNTQAVVKVTVP